MVQWLPALGDLAEPGLNSYHIHESSQPPGTPAPGALTHSSCHPGTRYTGGSEALVQTKHRDT